jgi:hypothetical protein
MEQSPQIKIDWDKMREDFMREGGYTKVNKIVSYGIEYTTLTYDSNTGLMPNFNRDYTSVGDLHLHVAPAADLDVRERTALIRDGVKQIALVVASNDKISEISATSPVVSENLSLFLTGGFKVDNSILTKFSIGSYHLQRMLRGVDPEEIKKITRVVIPRSEFLHRYLKK